MKTYRLSVQDRANISRAIAIESRTLGATLQAAGLVSAWQIESALQAKSENPNLKIGEILAQKEIIKPATADFFVTDWTKAVVTNEKQALGYYLQQAAILDREQIEVIFMSDNQLKTLPESIGMLQQIQEFHVETNLLQTLPENLCALPTLNNNELTAIRKNPLQAVPDCW
ncbi:MAG: hypothetical protein AAFQ41_08695, partial [Cyanobacteria bacterium J06623_7]